MDNGIQEILKDILLELLAVCEYTSQTWLTNSILFFDWKPIDGIVHSFRFSLHHTQSLNELIN